MYVKIKTSSIELMEFNKPAKRNSHENINIQAGTKIHNCSLSLSNRNRKKKFIKNRSNLQFKLNNQPSTMHPIIPKYNLINAHVTKR